jgi:hypothetical protein
MVRIFAITFLFLGLGISLAVLPIWPFKPGLSGAVLMLMCGFGLRAHWRRSADAPERPERQALLTLAGTCTVLGHLAGSLWLIGPAMELHSEAAHAMGSDSWILFGASLVMEWLARADGVSEDERDRMVRASALRFAAMVLAALQLGLVVWLSFGRSALLMEMTRPMIAHLFIASWMIAYASLQLACLASYARDRVLLQHAA